MRDMDVDLALGGASDQVAASVAVEVGTTGDPVVRRPRPGHGGAGAERAGARAGVLEEATLGVAGEHVGRTVAVLVTDADELAVAAHALGEHGALEPALLGAEQGDHAALVPGQEVVASVLVEVADGRHQRVVLGRRDHPGRRLELAVALARTDPEHALLAGGDQVEQAVAGQVGRDEHLGAVGPALGGGDRCLAEGGQATGGHDQRAAVAGAANDHVGVALAHQVGLWRRVADLERRRRRCDGRGCGGGERPDGRQLGVEVLAGAGRLAGVAVTVDGLEGGLADLLGGGGRVDAVQRELPGESAPYDWIITSGASTTSKLPIADIAKE